jgi:hypothetical protein
MAVMFSAGVTSKGGIVDSDSGRCGLASETMGDFVSVTLLDRNLLASLNREIEGAARGGDVEGNSMGRGQDGEPIGANLVGRIAPSRNAIGTGDDRLDASFAHDLGGHGIANQSGINVTLGEFPGGEPGTLEQRPCFIDEDVDAFLDPGR